MEAIALLIGTIRHFAWRFVPYGDMGMVSKGLAALSILWLLVIVRRQFKTKMMALVLLWWAWEETQVAVCSFWYVYAPWPVPQGMPICSAKAGIDLGALSLFVLSVILCAYITLMGDKSRLDEPK